MPAGKFAFEKLPSISSRFPFLAVIFILTWSRDKRAKATVPHASQRDCLNKNICCPQNLAERFLMESAENLTPFRQIRFRGMEKERGR